MSNHAEAKHIAERQAENDTDVKWEIENSTAQQIYVTAFAEGFICCDNMHRKLFENSDEKGNKLKELK